MSIPEVAKYLVFLSLNIVIAFCGAILLAFGAILQRDELKGVKSFGHLSIGGFAIGIGVLGLLIASWGIWALFKRKPAVLTYYAIVLLMLFVVQIILGAVALGSLSGANCEGEEDIDKAVQKLYIKNDAKAEKTINHIQKNFRCCGPTGPLWWRSKNRPYPPSCCPDQKDPCTEPYEKGCGPVYRAAIEKNVGVIGGVAIGFCPVELVAAVLGWFIRLTIKKMQYT